MREIQNCQYYKLSFPKISTMQTKPWDILWIREMKPWKHSKVPWVPSRFVQIFVLKGVNKNTTDKIKKQIEETQIKKELAKIYQVDGLDSWVSPNL